MITNNVCLYILSRDLDKLNSHFSLFFFDSNLEAVIPVAQSKNTVEAYTIQVKIVTPNILLGSSSVIILSVIVKKTAKTEEAWRAALFNPSFIIIVKKIDFIFFVLRVSV